MKYLVAFLVLAAVVLCFGPVNATRSQLILGEPLEVQLLPADTHNYHLPVEADQFVFVAIEQIGIDVIARLFDPERRQIGEFDANSPYENEKITFISEISGDYRIEVNAYDSNEPAGGYTIELERHEPKATTKAGQINQLVSPWTRAGFPALSIAVSRDGEALYNETFGLENLEYTIPATPETAFRLGSMSKMFTAYAIAMLHVEGALHLDDDVRKHIPEIPDLGHTVTVRHLVHHTSGLRELYNTMAIAGYGLDDLITDEQVLRFVCNQQQLNFEPGSEYLYCNTGYSLLAEIVYRATGKRLSVWAQEHLFQPLGMYHTRFVENLNEVISQRAYAYNHTVGGRFMKMDRSFSNVGPGGALSTAGDLMKWMQNYFDGRVGGPGVQQLIHELGLLNDGDTVRYAFGSQVSNYRGLTKYYHNSMIGGAKSHSVHYPEQGFSIAVLGNLRTFWPDDVAERIAEIYLKNELDDPKEPSASKSNSRQETPEQEPWIPSKDELLEYTGLFVSTELSTAYSLALTGDELIAQHVRNVPIKLSPSSKDQFRGSSWFFQRIHFERNDQGKVTGLRVSNSRTRDVLFIRQDM
jgi:CubicO group peptidase (beta-lactamase class C family)